MRKSAAATRAASAAGMSMTHTDQVIHCHALTESRHAFS